MKSYYDKTINDEVYHVSDIVRVLSVKPMEGHKLLLAFSTGEKRVFDLTPLLEKPAFRQLKNPGVFKSARIAFGTVVWNDELDLAPESLYRSSVPCE